MRWSVDTRRVALAVVVMGGLAVVGGCAGDDVMRVEAPTQAQVVVSFPQLADKAAGDFELELALRLHEQGPGEPELHRTIPVRGWVAQGPLEVPAQVMIMIDATCVLNGRDYFGFADVMPLAPGTSTVVSLQMIAP